MIAVFRMISILLRNVFLFVYGFADDIHVESKPMGIKKAQIRIWTKSVVRSGLNYVHQSCIVSTANMGIIFESAKGKRSFLLRLIILLSELPTWAPCTTII